jgi:hypothetical protein
VRAGGLLCLLLVSPCATSTRPEHVEIRPGCVAELVAITTYRRRFPEPDSAGLCYRTQSACGTHLRPTMDGAWYWLITEGRPPETAAPLVFPCERVRREYSPDHPNGLDRPM